jgi:hypothetical protein
VKCPNCIEVNLIMSERHGVEIDYCPQCRGVWLDRGELDKIVERTAGGRDAAAATAPQTVPPQRPMRRDDDSVDEDYDDRYRKKRKRGGWLGEIFDFD